MIFATWAALTDVVVMAKVAVVAPLLTVIEGGTLTAALSLESVTTAPPERAVLLRVTVPVDPDPPITVVGLTLTEEICSGSTVRGAEAALPL